MGWAINNIPTKEKGVDFLMEKHWKGMWFLNF